MSLKDRVFVITGAAGNLGEACVRVFQHEHADVYAAVRRAEDLGVLRATVPLPEKLKGGVYDLSRPDEADRLMEDAAEAYGALHGVANLVGGWAGGQSVIGTSEETFDRMIAINLKTAWNVSRAAVRTLSEEGGGAIVNVGATWANRMAGVEGMVAYVTAKAAVVALTRAIAAEARTLGVRANCVAPGSMLPKGARAADPKNAKLVPPDLVAHAIAYLCSDAAEGATGSVLDIPARP
jgi:NAD(P)-dependent dehydrogenase (short-subunit alcohol dehydrogenase family)